VTSVRYSGVPPSSRREPAEKRLIDGLRTMSQSGEYGQDHREDERNEKDRPIPLDETDLQQDYSDGKQEGDKEIYLTRP
jgi:hypothetical protein